MTNPTNSVCPECNSEVLPTQYCMMGHWCGEPVVPTLTAHDTLAPQLRERLAEAERELAEAKDELALIRYLVASSGIEIAETDKTGYIVSVLTSVLKDTDELWKAANKREREWATKWQEAHAEAADLRARLADEDARWHTLTDGYAGAMRELAEAKEFISAYEAWANDTTVVWGSKFGELVLAFEALRAAQRPEAEGREG